MVVDVVVVDLGIGCGPSYRSASGRQDDFREPAPDTRAGSRPAGLLRGDTTGARRAAANVRDLRIVHDHVYDHDHVRSQ